MKDKPVILIVDDQPQNIELLEAYLMPQGYEIIKAANGEEALEKLSGNQIDLILLDVIMPGMDGFEVTRRIRQDDKIRLLPIILVTILWEKEDRIKGIEAGCDDFLSTPVDKTELLARIRSLLKVKDYNDLMSNYRKELESEVTRRTDELKHALENLQQEITERKRTEEMLLDSEARYRTLYEISADGILIADTEMKTFKYANPALCRMLGYTEEELKTLGLADIHPKEDLPRVIAEFEAQARGDKTLAPDIPCLRKDGTILYADINSTMLTIDNRPYNVGFFRDITGRKQNEERLQKLNRSLKIISECNSCLVRANDEKDLLNDVCQIIRKTGEYSIVWIGFLEIAEKDVLRPVAYAGSEFFDYASEKIDLTDPNGRNKILRAVFSSGQFQVCEKLPDGRQPCFGPPSAAKEAYRAILSLPLFLDNRIMGALTIYSVSADTFDDEEKKLLLELADDISYGISSLRTGVKHKRAEEQVMINLKKIENALEGTVMALTATSEMRDPYTAGHQRRVTQLACAIACDIGLTQDRINSIRIAGLLHDIGKIQIPAEILTKPSKLSEIEFAIIKTHSKAAYDIVKSIDFPWPVAQYILQHHEKLNGTGYPSGLKGDEILLESRILCVADIVEAMSSHRPYRPALGIDVALSDMLANKDVLYDPVVVDSCVKLFREKGFKFE